jgi:hypothetical protein
MCSGPDYFPFIVKGTRVDVPPPGGLETVTPAVPGAAMSAAGIAAANREALTKIVGLAKPFHRIVAPLTKSLPMTVRVNARPPAVLRAGLRPVIAGTRSGLILVTKPSPTEASSQPPQAAWKGLAVGKSVESV